MKKYSLVFLIFLAVLNAELQTAYKATLYFLADSSVPSSLLPLQLKWSVKGGQEQKVSIPGGTFVIPSDAYYYASFILYDKNGQSGHSGASPNDWEPIPFFTTYYNVSLINGFLTANRIPNPTTITILPDATTKNLKNATIQYRYTQQGQGVLASKSYTLNLNTSYVTSLMQNKEGALVIPTGISAGSNGSGSIAPVSMAGPNTYILSLVDGVLQLSVKQLPTPTSTPINKASLKIISDGKTVPINPNLSVAWTSATGASSNPAPIVLNYAYPMTTNTWEFTAGSQQPITGFKLYYNGTSNSSPIMLFPTQPTIYKLTIVNGKPILTLQA